MNVRPPNNAMQLDEGRLDACGSIIVGKAHR